jgi:hypothetical protein
LRARTPMLNSDLIGTIRRFWLGNDFIREGTILDVNQDGEVYVRWHYRSLPDSWVSISKLC